MCNTAKSTSISYPDVKGFIQCIEVKTIFEKPTKKIDLSYLDSSDVAALKTEDPFMYYSIKSAANVHRGSEMTVNRSGRHCKGQNPFEHEALIVKRKTRVSYEMYPSVTAAEAAEVKSDLYSFILGLENDDIVAALAHKQCDSLGDSG
jgi:hypothetical protein